MIKSMARCLALVVLTAAGVQGCSQAPGPRQPAAPGQPAASAPRVSGMIDISAGCPGNNAEVEEATSAPGYVYADWIGCGGIGFARSADSGGHFSAPVTVPGSAGRSWDPAIAVSADGTVYLSYMHASGTLGRPDTTIYPVVAISRDHGGSFAEVYPVFPPKPGNWGDRDFIAAGSAGHLYVTWDYGPSVREVRLLCAKAGSCAYSSGDFNAVIQTSADGGRSWGPITHIEPRFPLGGGYGAPLVVGPEGRIDVLYTAHPTDQGTLAVHPGHEFFTSSPDGTHWPASPAALWPAKGTLSVAEWWIDGDISADAAGNLYVTWDTQTAAGDIGWLTYSTDGGRTWSAPVRVTPDTDSAPHITESAGGQAGVAYVAWQTSAPAQGYATYLRPFSIRRGWLGPAIDVSARYGKTTVWPGDTFGISPLADGQISLTWGSAVGTSKYSEIYAATARF